MTERFFRYTRFDPATLRERQFRSLLKLFNELLLRTDGDVEKALEWLKRLWQRYRFFDGQVSFEEFRQWLERQNVLKSEEGRTVLTIRGERQISAAALEEVFTNLSRDVMGNHPTAHEGQGFDNLSESRPYAFGDPLSSLAFQPTLRNALRRYDGELSLCEEDLEVFEQEHLASAATCLLLDISHSMTLYGEDRITPAKKVALALTHLITTRYPKDSLDVVLFGDEAFRVDLSQLPYVSNGPYHTNTKAALVLARQLLANKRQANKQIFMITDGKPSAIFEDDGLYINSFGLDPKIVAQTLDEATRCRRKGITITTFMVATDPYLQRFVDQLTLAAKGRAYYTSVEHLGSYMLTDYVRNRRRRIQ